MWLWFFIFTRNCTVLLKYRIIANFSSICYRTGSLSLSATRQAQLMERIRQNPEFLKGMRAQLQGVFEDLLDKRGVPRVSGDVHLS